MNSIWARLRLPRVRRAVAESSVMMPSSLLWVKTRDHFAAAAAAGALPVSTATSTAVGVVVKTAAVATSSSSSLSWPANSLILRPCGLAEQEDPGPAVTTDAPFDCGGDGGGGGGGSGDDDGGGGGGVATSGDDSAPAAVAASDSAACAGTKADPTRTKGNAKTRKRLGRSQFEIDLNCRVPDWRLNGRLDLKKNFYLADDEIATLVADHLRGDIDEGRYILEANPGFGYLSRRLVNMGCRKLHLFAPARSPLLVFAEALASEHPNTVKVIPESLLAVGGIFAYDAHRGKTHRMEALLEGLPTTRWTDPPRVTVFAALNRFNEFGFLRSLVYHVVPRSGLFSLGRVELLLLMSETELRLILGRQAAQSAGQDCPPTTNNKNNPTGEPQFGKRPYGILYATLFEGEKLATIDHHHIFGKASYFKQPAASTMCLVRLRPRLEIDPCLNSPAVFEEFAFFVRQALWRGDTVAHCFDSWIPRFGEQILLERELGNEVLENVRLMRKMSTLTPRQHVELFKLFRAHEAYEFSSFHAAMGKACVDSEDV